MYIYLQYILLVGWLVGCGLTSHSAITQLYSDKTVVQFPNLDLLPGTQHHGQLGVFSVQSSRAPGRLKTALTLPSEGQNTARVCRESKADLTPDSHFSLPHVPLRHLSGEYILRNILRKKRADILIFISFQLVHDIRHSHYCWLMTREIIVITFFSLPP